MVEYRQALPAGFVLAGDYRISGVLGQGGFGITYKAEDLRLGTPVAIKEYFPSDLAVRDGGSTVEPRSARDTGVLAWGRAKFLDEAKTLARFRHPSIVRVSRLFEANNTAYMVLDFEMGPSLAEWRSKLARAPSQAEVDRISAKLLDAVGAVHEAGILHRDIKPANVIMRDGAEPVLIDFGAARQALSAQSKTVHAIVTPGYSPKEQYAVDLDRQGPWSDIYALGATLYHLVTGRAPPDALSRELGEDMQMAASMGGTWRSGFLDAIDKAMRVDATARPQTTAEWREMLFAPSPSARAGEAATMATHRTSSFGLSSAAALPPGRSGAASAPRRLSFDDLPPAGAAAAAKGHRSRGSAVLASGLAGLLAVAGLGYWILVEAPARDEAAWQRASSANTAVAYARYLAEQPSGRHVSEARQRQSELREIASATTGGDRTIPRTAPSADPTEERDASRSPLPAPEPTITPAISVPDRTGGDAPADPTAPSPDAAAGQPPAQAASTDTLPNASEQPAVNASPEVAPPRTGAQKQLASSNPSAPRPADTPSPSSARTSADSSGSFRARAESPPALPQDEIARLASAATPGKWSLAVEPFGIDRVSGFTDQSGDFISELKRISGEKLDVSPSGAASSLPRLAWQSPFTQADRHLEFALFSGAVPLGLSPNDHVRWLRAEGARLLEQTLIDTGSPSRAIPCGIAGGVGAWFQKEVRSPADFRNLKVRAPRLMAETLTKLGARSVTLSSNSELAAAFTSNRLDANFDVTPLTHIFLVQSRPAAVYHYPGVHNPSYLFTLLISPDVWSVMGEPQQRLIEEACRRNLDRWAQHFPTTQSNVLDQIRRQRVVVRPFTGPLREALRKSVDQVLAEEAAKSPRFKDILESYNRFRS